MKFCIIHVMSKLNDTSRRMSTKPTHFEWQEWDTTLERVTVLEDALHNSCNLSSKIVNIMIKILNDHSWSIFLNICIIIIIIIITIIIIVTELDLHLFY